MSQPFSLASSRCASMADPALHAEILGRTGSEEATSAILRSIDRFGGDDSIQRFDVTPKAKLRSRPGREAWTVSAVRK